MFKSIGVLTVVLFLALATGSPCLAGSAVYVGSETCGECHPEEYENYSRYSKKASSFTSIRVMKSKLTDAEYRSCFQCHTTGFGKTGGFVSEEKTPGLKNAGCEVCHGPGSLHSESQDPEDIVTNITVEDCQHCHSSDRIEAFDFKPLLFGGAH